MSKRSKIQAEEKIRIAEACTAGSMSLNAAAEQLGVHQSAVDDWVGLYQTEGISAFLPQRENRRYDPTLKEAAVKDYLSGKDSLRQICKIYKIRSTRLRTWIKVYNGRRDFKKQTGGSRMTKGRETAQADRIPVAKACIANGKNRSCNPVPCQLSAGLELDPQVHRGRRCRTGRPAGGSRKREQQPLTKLEQAQIENEQLKHRLKMLEMENHLQKNWRRSKGGAAKPGSSIPYLPGN